MKLKLENARLTKELVRLKKLFEYSEDGAVGGIELSDSNSFDAHSTDGGGSSSRIERLEAELKLAKQQITRKDIEKSSPNSGIEAINYMCSHIFRAEKRAKKTEVRQR